MGCKIKLVPNSYYHIYNRGVEKRNIFLNENDYKRFQMLLYLCNNTYPINMRELFYKGLTFVNITDIERKNILIDIGAYCLMPNHIHLLITPKEDNSSRFMQKLFTAYTMYFNKKNRRTGRLFESTFKAKLIDRNEYLKYLFAYIHLNPVKLIESSWKEKGIQNINRAKTFLDSYPWSSYPAYISNFNNPIINKSAFPDYFINKKEFSDFIHDWLDFQELD